jgi:hypothetical protein
VVEGQEPGRLRAARPLPRDALTSSATRTRCRCG